MEIVFDCSLCLDMNRLALLGKREVVGDAAAALCTFDLLGMKGVLSSAFTVCSHACQGTAAAILLGHLIGNGSN